MPGRLQTHFLHRFDILKHADFVYISFIYTRECVKCELVFRFHHANIRSTARVVKLTRWLIISASKPEGFNLQAFLHFVCVSSGQIVN